MNTPLYIAVHEHRFGKDIKIFASGDDAETIFANLDSDDSFGNEPDDDVDSDMGVLTQVDFAKRINVDFEPELGETLTIHFIDADSFTAVDLSDFKA
jgi:hypothetical protein